MLGAGSIVSKPSRGGGGGGRVTHYDNDLAINSTRKLVIYVSYSA